MRDEDQLMKDFNQLAVQCKSNIAGDSPSKDDVLIIFARDYINSLKKLIAEKDFKLDIAESRLAKFDKQGVVNE